MHLSPNPNPKRILNSPCTPTNSFEALLESENSNLRMLPYSLNRIELKDTDPIFIENGQLSFHPIKRSIAITVTLSLIISIICCSIFVASMGFNSDDLWIIIFLTSLICFGGAAIYVWIAWCIRILGLWPILIDQSDEGIRVSLVHRRHWCLLNTLSPSLATGVFEWIGGQQRKPIPSKKLPDTLKNNTHASWLELKYKDRKRWVLLSLHDNSDDASDSIIDWAQKLELTGEEVFSTSEPPSQVFYNHLDKKLW